MGAEQFQQVGTGDTIEKAFHSAVDRALYDYGHRGYTGSLAEKHEFTEIEVPTGVEPRKFAEQLLHDGDARVDDKWGPAGAVKLGPDTWLFFGWASS